MVKKIIGHFSTPEYVSYLGKIVYMTLLYVFSGVAQLYAQKNLLPTCG